MTLKIALLLSASWTLAVVPPVSGQDLSLSLAEARKLAFEQNAMLTSARQELAAARGTRLQTGAGFLPSVRITETWMRTNDAVGAFGTRLRQERFTQADFALANLNSPAAITNFETRLEIRQPVFNGGVSWARRGQASAGVRAAEAGLRQAENEIAYRTAQAYWGYVLSTQGLAAVRQGVLAARSGLAIVEAHHAEGNVPLSDLLEARVRLAEVESMETDAESRVETAREGLTLILGLPADAAIAPTDSMTDPGPMDPLRDMAAEAASNRPDIEMMEHMTRAARLETRVSRAAWIPHLNAFLDAALDSEKPFEREGERWSAGAILSWDLFSGGRTIGAHRAARAQARSAEARLAFAKEQAERDIRQAVRDLSAARHRLRLGEAIVAQSAERHRITVLRYQEGLATTTDLVGAEAALTGAQVKHAETLHDVNVSAARLRFAVGVRGS